MVSSFYLFCSHLRWSDCSFIMLLSIPPNLLTWFLLKTHLLSAKEFVYLCISQDSELQRRYCRIQDEETWWTQCLLWWCCQQAFSCTNRGLCLSNTAKELWRLSHFSGAPQISNQFKSSSKHWRHQIICSLKCCLLCPDQSMFYEQSR